MLKTIKASLLLTLLCGAAFAQETTIIQNPNTKQTTKPEFSFIPEVNTQSSLQVQVGGGLLDDKGITGHHGTPILGLIKANYNLFDGSSLFIDLPMAGTWSGGNDDFGIGNVSIGGNYRILQSGMVSTALGLNVTFPTSQSGALIGAFTRNGYAFAQDQYAFSPFLNLMISDGRILASFDAGLYEQLHTNRFPGQDKFDSIIFYDGGLNLAIDNAKDYWATLEFGGYTSLTNGSGNETALFGGPGIRYQDDEKSIGLHLEVPFNSTPKDQIDLLVLLDTRFKF